MSHTKIWMAVSGIAGAIVAICAIYGVFSSAEPHTQSVSQTGISTSGSRNPVTGIVNGSVSVDKK